MPWADVPGPQRCALPHGRGLRACISWRAEPSSGVPCLTTSHAARGGNKREDCRVFGSLANIATYR